MFCQRFFTLLTLSLSIAPAVLAVPGFSFERIENPLSHNTPSHNTPTHNAPSHNNGNHQSNSGHHGSTHSTGSHHGSKSGKPPRQKVGHKKDICGSILTSKQTASHERKLKHSRVSPKNSRAGPVTFDTYFHVIAANETEAGGNVSDEDIAAQMKVLDSAFDLAGFDFNLINVTRTFNEEWFYTPWSEDPEFELDVKSQLRQGDAATLNIYSTNPGDGLLGYAYFPFMYEDGPEVDGVVIHWGSLPNGFLEEYDGGMTLVHELGHWLGLYHTFQGSSCDGPGDYISDTPQQATASSSCQPSDSCAHLSGGDPYTNFMDYSPDACLSEFTTGQIRRMREEIRTYRGVENA